jgi:hypothetical protein
MAGMWLEGKDKPIYPATVYPGPSFDYLSHHGVTVPQGIGKFTSQGWQVFIQGDALGKITAIE